MKIFLINFILIFELPFINFAQPFNFPSEIKSSDVFVMSIKDHVVTAKSNVGTELWQFELQSGKILFHFKSGTNFDQEIFESYFKDNGVQYNFTKAAYDINHNFSKICKINNYYVDENNEIYAIVNGNMAKSDPRGDPKSDFIMTPFFVLIKLGYEKISESYAINDLFIEPGYYFDDNSFYKKGDHFIFTVYKQKITNTNNYFLGKWQNISGQLRFSGFVEVELPDFNKTSGIGYGLMNFMYKNRSLMFFSCPEIYNLNNFTSKKLEVKQMPESQLNGHAKGQSFDINFMVCDFLITQEELKMIVRKSKNFYIYYYDAKTYQFKHEKLIPNLTTDDLYRWPFFAEGGEILLVLKGKGQINVLTIK